MSIGFCASCLLLTAVGIYYTVRFRSKLEKAGYVSLLVFLSLVGLVLFAYIILTILCISNI